MCKYTLVIVDYLTKILRRRTPFRIVNPLLNSTEKLTHETRLVGLTPFLKNIYQTVTYRVVKGIFLA